jgi:N-sulfoglucosamine sulfohydrolase
MYYPMRAVRTRRYKYILNLAPQLPYPQASDILGSPSWKAIVARKPEQMGQQVMKTYFERPAEELYDLEKDPNELRNVAADSAYSASLKEMQGKMLAFREKTKDLWLREKQGSRGYQVH